jgi:hypothetical protein
VPPLTPGTNKKMTEALKASFASWEKEQVRLLIPKGALFFLNLQISFGVGESLCYMSRSATCLILYSARSIAWHSNRCVLFHLFIALLKRYNFH